MKLMCPEKRLAKLSFLFVLIALLLSSGVQAQTKKAAASKKAVVKKNEKQAKDAKKDSRRDKQTAKSKKTDPKKEKASAKSKDAKKDKKKEKALAKSKAKSKDASKDTKKEKLSAKDKAREKNAKNKKDPKKLAEARKAEAERKRVEEARRQAALAEQRRREQLAREARERRIAFERGLRTETVRNIENDNTEGEDLNVRRAAVNALGSHAGTVVVMEAQTGKVLTIVNQDWAIRNSFKPCSTIKLVTGVAGLNENIINEDGGIGRSSSGMTLDTALARSNNGYFQRVGVNMGSGKMVDYARRLGLGETTGINAEGETAGRVPNGNNNARIYSHGDDFEVTPLQLAVMVSALSNGGKKVVPQIPRGRSEKSNFRAHLKAQVNVPMRSVEGVLPGMIGAAEYGTARRGVDSSMGVAGKTGSCIGKGSWVGLFASVAPVEDPKYSVVVITRGQSERGKYAAAIAGKVYQALGSQITRNRDAYLARKHSKDVLPADSRIAEVDDEEADDVETEDTGGDTEQRIVVGKPGLAPAPIQAPAKKLIKTAQSRPTFTPVVITVKKSSNSYDVTEKTRPRIVKNK